MAQYQDGVKIEDDNLEFNGTVRVKASKFTIVDDTDTTKKAQMVCSGISSGQTSEITIPDSDDTAATLSGTQTLSNKTLTSPALTAAATDASVGTVGAAPVSGTIAATIERVGSFFKLNLALTAAQLAVSDDGANGSYATDVLFDFVESGVLILGCRQNYTAFAVDGTGVPDDAVFEIGVGSTAIAAEADGVLGATEDDIGGDVNITLSGGTGTGTAHTGASVAIDGTTTAATLNLNWSGSAATVDGNGTIDVTGTICVVGMLLGDD